MDAKCKYTINDKADIKSVIEYLVRDVKATHVLSEAKEFEVKLVMNELLSNCFKYCKICPEAPVIVEYRVKDKSLNVIVSDCGTGFDVDATHYKAFDTAATENLYAENGRGLFLADQLTSALTFNEEGNQVTAVMDLT